MSICSICGEMESVTKGLVRDGEFICSKHLLKCADCGTLFFEDDEHIEADGDIICENCMENYYYCEYCGGWHYQDNFVSVNTSYGEDYMCESCADDEAFYCDNCGEYYLRRDFSHYDRRNSRDTICGNCVNNGDFCICEDCGKVDRYDNMTEGDDGYMYCDDCIDNHENNKPIHEYGWNPEDNRNGYNFYKNNDEEKPRYHIGFELEVEGDESCAEDYLNHFANGEDVIFLTHDSSIENGGFEITTHPMTFDYFYNSKFNNELGNSLKFLDNHGFKSHNRGGLHVHVSRDNISNKQIAIMAIILYNSYMSDEYKKVLGITQRKADKIERWASVTIPNDFSKEEFFNYIMYHNGRISNDRYTALNVSYKTVEFRIFNGNLRMERLLKNIEFVEAMLGYSKILENELKIFENENDFPMNDYFNKYATMDALIQYINTTGGKYYNLKDFLNEKDIKANKNISIENLEDAQYNS